MAVPKGTGQAQQLLQLYDRKFRGASNATPQRAVTQHSLLATNLDLLELILSFLASSADLHRAAQVCQQWRRCLSGSNSRFWSLLLQRLSSPEALPAAPPFSQWNTGHFTSKWTRADPEPADQEAGQSAALASLMGLPYAVPEPHAAHPSASQATDVFQPPLIPWAGPLDRIAHSSGALAALTAPSGGQQRGSWGPSLDRGVSTPKGLALDLLFLTAQAHFIKHQPIRIPLVDTTSNSAQVYPCIFMPRVRAPLTADSFFALSGLHEAVRHVSVVEELIGVKSVRQRYDLQLREMRKLMVWRMVLDKQAQASGTPSHPRADRCAPFWRFISCLGRLVQYAAGNRVLYIVCRSQRDPQPAVSPVPVFWIAQSRHSSLLGFMSSAKWD